MDRIITAKDLKEWLNKIPDDAYVYWQELLKDKIVTFVTPLQDTDDGRQTCQYFELPQLMFVPMTNKMPHEHIKNLIELYNRKW